MFYLFVMVFYDVCSPRNENLNLLAKSNSWIYFYIVLNKNWKIYWSWARGLMLIVRTVSDKAKTLPWQCHCTNLAEYYKLAIKGDIPEESLQDILYILYVKLFIIHVAHYFYNKMKRIGYYHNYNTFVVKNQCKYRYYCL